jgi:glycosyltransferase involved in cell wall biosynthesis
MISALILTLNEKANITACIASLPWRSDVHVLDSGSTDRTVECAMMAGAQVTQRAFDGYASQRNAGLALPFAHDWIVMIDADERMTPELAREIEAAITTAPTDVAMFLVRRKDMFMGRWLRRSSGYPTWFARVLRKGRVRVDREINEVYIPDGRTLRLTNHLLHYPFNKGMERWFERHNRYSSQEAQILGATGDKLQNNSVSLGDRAATRRAKLKRLAYRLPLRPFIVFFYLYIIRLGFLDGAAGYHYATMRMAYEVMIDAKVRAARFTERD